jgi:hypothetical protein
MPISKRDESLDRFACSPLETTHPRSIHVARTKLNIVFGHIAGGVETANRGQRRPVALCKVLQFHRTRRRCSDYITVLAFETLFDSSNQSRGGAHIPSTETQNDGEVKVKINWRGNRTLQILPAALVSRAQA